MQLPRLPQPYADPPPPALPGVQPADQVYTFERWNKHRNQARYARHLLHMFSSRVFRSLLPPVLTMMFLGIFVGLYETLLKVGAAVCQLVWLASRPAA